MPSKSRISIDVQYNLYVDRGLRNVYQRYIYEGSRNVDHRSRNVD